MSNSKRLLLASALLTVAPLGSALAQETAAASAAGQVTEVVVTAQKRAENVQKVPLSIVAVSGAQLTSAGIENPTQLRQIVPSLQITPIAQAAGVVVSIRGFGSASNAAIDPDVAPYLDGIFLPRPGALLTSFLDINNVEVLRGPQGTLFGRNSTVGAIAITTNEPSFRAATADVAAEAASYGTYKLQGVGNLPLSDTFAIRAAALAGTTDGYVKNSFDGKTYGADDHYLARVSAKWDITPSLTWLMRVDDARTTGDGVNYNAIDTSTLSAGQLAAYTTHIGAASPTLSDPPSFNVHQRFDANLTDSQWGLSSDLSWQVGGGFALRLIDSYREWQNQQSDGDVIYTTLDLLNRNVDFASHSQSHELQLISPKDMLGGRLSFVAGLYYFREYYNITTSYDLGSQYCGFVIGVAAPKLLPACNAGPLRGALTNEFNQVESSLAGYVQADFKITDALTLTLGGRETDDRKTGDLNTQIYNPGVTLLGAAEADPSLRYSKSEPTYRANLSWQIAPTIMAFTSYSTGYKSGGFNSAISAPALGAANRTFLDETSEDYELGVKSTFFNRRLLLNADIYQTDITNFQDRSFNGLTFIVKNSGDIRARGLEVDGQYRPVDHVKIDFGGDYLDSIYTSFTGAPGRPGCTGAATSCPTTQNLSGRPSDDAPKYQGHLAVEYDTDPFMGGYSLQLRPDVTYEDRFYSTNDLNSQAIIKSHALLGARVNLVSPDQRYTLTVYGTNLTDGRYFTGKFPQALDSLLGVRVPATGATLYRGYLGEPIVVGVRLAGKF